MRYLFILISAFLLLSCSSKSNRNNTTSLNIDTYQKDMTYEKFRQYVIEYAEKATYPSLSNK